MSKIFYLVFSLAVVGGYAYVNARGVDPFASSDERAAAPPDATQRGGGGIFWYGGFGGGK